MPEVLDGSWVIRGARLLDPGNGVDAWSDIWIENGKIAAIGEYACENPHTRELDAEGCWVIPGMVELSARLDGVIYRESALAREGHAALSSGITTCCIPADVDPCIDTPAVAELIQLRARQNTPLRVATLGALTVSLAGEQLSEMRALQEVACVGLTNGRRAISNTLIMRHALTYARGLGMRVWIYGRDPWLHQAGIVHEGSMAGRLGLPGIPAEAEAIGIARDLSLVELCGVRAHFCRISSAASIRLLMQAHERGLPVSADIAIHHLHLTDESIINFNSLCYVDPPLRSDRDREVLLESLNHPVVEAICSDHTPLAPEDKGVPFAETYPGIAGMETLLGLTLALCRYGYLDERRLIYLLTTGPRRLLDIETATLQCGAPADLTLIDPDTYWRVDPERFLGVGRNTPYKDWVLSAKVRHTILGSRIYGSDVTSA